MNGGADSTALQNDVTFRAANAFDSPQLKTLWQKGFGDTEAFLDYFFSRVYNSECAFVACAGDIIIAEAHIRYIPLYYAKTYPAAYIYGVTTRPDYRERGVAGGLIGFVCESLKKSGLQAAFLIPQKRELFAFYKKLGFTTAFLVLKSAFSLNAAVFFTDADLNKYTAADFIHADLAQIYDFYINSYKQTGFCALKGFDDFKAFTYLFLLDNAYMYTYQENGVVSALAFVTEESGRLCVKELLTPPRLREHFLSCIAQTHKQTSIDVTEPATNACNASPFAMLRVLERGLRVPQGLGYANILLNE